MVRTSNGIAAALVPLAPMKYEFIWRSLELLSEKKSNIHFGHNAKGRATAVNPLFLFPQYHTFGIDSRKPDSNTVENKNGRTIRWYVFPLFGWLCHQ